MNFDWLNIMWLMHNLHWFILLLVVSIIILFFFPLLLGLDLKGKAEKMKDKQKSE